MKLFLDDERQAPKEWTLVTNANAILLHMNRAYYDLKSPYHCGRYKITHISLDHDLGEDVNYNGADVMNMIFAVDRVTNYLDKDVVITSHSANPEGKQRIERIIEEWKQMKNA